MSPRRLLGSALGAAIALAAAACELAVGLDPYEAGCPTGQKACPDVNTHVKKCVQDNDPEYGCSASGCQSCASAANGNVPPRGVPSVFNCGTGGVCVPNGTSCPIPWQHCDMIHPYCESYSLTDAENCGRCMNSCTAGPTPPHATTVGCVAGLCKVTLCELNFADCNGDPADGCEVALGPSNCWSCPPLTDAGTACCHECYAGPMGFPTVCPACNPDAGTCNMQTMTCE